MRVEDAFVPLSSTQVVEDRSLDQLIKLHTVDGKHMPMFITANARCRGCHRPRLHMRVRHDPPEAPWWWRFIPMWLRYRLARRAFEEWRAKPDIHPKGFCECDTPRLIPVVGPEGSEAGKTLVICGAGPSLAEAKRRIMKADHVWGCNRAANWLVDRGWPITHAVSIDPSENMITDAWADVPDAPEFLLATSVNPALTDHVLLDLKPVRFFHSIRGGFAGELELYQVIYPECPIVGRGLNVVNRALELAIWLGYDKVWLAGADCSFGAGDLMYAGGTPGVVEDPEAIVQSEPLEGRVYRTRPDMLMSARSLVEFKMEYPDRVEFASSNSMPAAMYRRELAEPGFVKRCIQYAGEAAGKREVTAA